MDNRFEKTKPKESTLFNQLPENIQVEIFHNLNIQEKSNLAMVDRNCYQLFSKYIYVQKLIMLVAHGDEAGASSLLDRFPNLALERGDITDYSGRTFKNITAYEYAYWARDWHMLDMLEAHMSPEQKTKMLKKIDYPPTFRDNSERVTVSGNQINYDEPIYIVLLEEDLDLTDEGYTQIGLKVGFIQEYEFVDYYPVSVKIDINGKYTTIKRRNN